MPFLFGSGEPARRLASAGYLRACPLHTTPDYKM
jgi:hypothetical protein